LYNIYAILSYAAVVRSFNISWNTQFRHGFSQKHWTRCSLTKTLAKSIGVQHKGHPFPITITVYAHAEQKQA